MSYKLLETIKSPDDVKKLGEKDIPVLCEEIREFLVENTRKNGGHLASNLGVTELSVALHRVFSSPDDHIIFDVGHQSYVHKLLTGRREAFSTLRKTGGLSGFTKISESPHDPFGAGHSSTSISAALGFAEADRLMKRENYTVAVIGDGSYTGGMVHEALNNCAQDLPLIIILNENGMSISLNKGTFATYLSKVRISKGYRSWKHGTNSFLNKIPLIGKPIKSVLTFIRLKFKNLLFASNYFEDLGLYYMGPIDGNDYKKVENALKKAKQLKKCVVVHIKTVKGKGYEPAENSPEEFHGIGTGTAQSTTFHSVFADTLIDLAENDESIVAITAAMGKGTGLDAFEARYPERYFDVGIAEGHAVTFAAGLSAAGLKPYVAIYSTFLQRAYDSLIHDVALQDLPVKLFVDRAGISKADGATHHGIFDVSFLSHIPGMVILAPATYEALQRSIAFANECNAPVAVRYPNSSESEKVISAFYKNFKSSELGVRTTFDVDNLPEKVFITYGTIVGNVLDAAEILKSHGDLSVGVVLLERLKPYDTLAKMVLPYLLRATRIVFAEEGIKNGGAGMLLLEELKMQGFNDAKCNYSISAIDDNFASPENPCDIYDYVGLSAEKLVEQMNN